MSGSELLEQALHRCRSDLLSTMGPYWIGTAPFVMGFLHFWTDMSTGAQAESRLFIESVGLLLLWIWMIVWQAVYCDRLRAEVSGLPPREWTLSSVARLTAIQTAIQGPAIAALTISALITAPFGWVFAFFQNGSVLAGSAASVSVAWQQAARQSALWPKQNWQLIGCAGLLAVMLFVNTMLSILLSAHLLNSVFGFSTALTRSPYAILSPTVITACVSTTYLLLDPVVKAAYVLRCFYGESTRTGADLRLLLRRASGVALLALTIEAPSAMANPQQYDRTIDEVLRRPEYSWREPAQQRSPKPSVIGEGLRTVVKWLQSVVEAIIRWFRKIPPSSPEAAPSDGNIRTSVVLASLAVAGLLVVIGFRYWRKTGEVTRVASTPVSPSAVDVADESISPDQLPEAQWLELADRLASAGEMRLALRALFLGALAKLNSQELITLERHKTNLDYDRELSRRARNVPQVSYAFRDIAQVFERCWYGSFQVDEDILRRVRTTLPALAKHA